MNATADLPDLRDKLYSPSLRRLPARRLVNQATVRLPAIRNQGSEGACTAMALANVIDIQRLTDDSEAPPVSPRMLFEMAKVQQRTTPGEEPQLYSLRPIIKAFFHNGVCLEGEWPFAQTIGAEKQEISVERAKAARNIILGAYFRIAAYLDDYHAALNETGALLVAANVHSNWQRDNVARSRGRILPAVGEGAHAFVLIGYDSEGFLVLNSWGGDWGGFDGQPGVAHWRYEDWANSIIDAWVLRLAVSTPSAFDFTLGENGLSASFSSIRQAPVRRAMLTGHYVHLDDGRHVDLGTYCSSRALVEETVQLLRSRARSGRDDDRTAAAAPKPATTTERRYTDVLLRFASSSQNLEQSARIAAPSLAYWKGRGIYPFWVFWSNDHAVECSDALNAVIAAAYAQVGRTGKALDTLIEQRTRGLGRAVWRDLKESARRAMGSDGDGYHAVTALARLCASCGIRLHLLSEGEGVFPLAEFLQIAMVAADDRAVLALSLASLSLMAPTCTVDAFRTWFAPVLRGLEGRAKPIMTVHVPSPEFEARMRVGPYEGSYFRMIANVFEDAGSDGRPLRLLGAGAPATGADEAIPGVRFRPRKLPDAPVRQLGISDLIDDASVRRCFEERLPFGMRKAKGARP